ncbi:hypothetical protein C5B91_21295 [Haloferax sp. Atlit-10N]|nr:hypothetical protein C5B91_21295 [Haloferax sp. Atlit-10N]
MDMAESDESPCAMFKHKHNPDVKLWAYPVQDGEMFIEVFKDSPGDGLYFRVEAADFADALRAVFDSDYNLEWTTEPVENAFIEAMRRE